MNALFAALAGAALGGLVRSPLRSCERRTSRRATYRALTTEIRLLCAAARRERLFERCDGAARELAIEPSGTGYVIFPDGMSLTPIFDANVAHIGHLKPNQAELIVQFHLWANMIQTVGGVAGGVARASSHLMRRRNVAYLAFPSRSMLAVGDRICPPLPNRREASAS